MAPLKTLVLNAASGFCQIPLSKTKKARYGDHQHTQSLKKEGRRSLKASWSCCPYSYSSFIECLQSTGPKLNTDLFRENKIMWQTDTAGFTVIHKSTPHTVQMQSSWTTAQHDTWKVYRICAGNNQDIFLWSRHFQGTTWCPIITLCIKIFNFFFQKKYIFLLIKLSLLRVEMFIHTWERM